MRYELNFLSEPFETYSEFDEESETFETELADLEWEEEAGRRRRPRPAVARARARSRIVSPKRLIKGRLRPPIRSPRPPIRSPRPPIRYLDRLNSQPSHCRLSRSWNPGHPNRQRQRAPPSRRAPHRPRQADHRPRPVPSRPQREASMSVGCRTRLTES